MPRCLESGGVFCNLQDAAGEAEFLKACSESPPHVVLLDLTEEELLAGRTLDLLRTAAPAAGIVWVADSPSLDTTLEALRQGVDDIILKDSEDGFAPAIEHALRKSQKRGETLVRSETERLRQQALEQVPNGVLIVDYRQNNRPIIYCNDGFLRLTGYSRDEVLGRNCRFLQGPNTDREVREELHAAIEEGRPFRGDILNYRKDGSTFWNDLELSPIRDGRGEITHYFGIQRDITRQRESEESRGRTEERFRRAIDGFPHTFVIYDSERRITHINKRGLEISGKTREEIIGRRDEEIHPPEVTSGYLPYLLKAVETGEPQDFELAFDLPTGNYYVAVNYIPLLDEKGNVREILGFTHDLSERRRMEEALRASERRFRRAVDGFPYCFVIYDAERRFTYVNDRGLEIASLPREAILGKRDEELFPEEMTRHYLPQLRKAASTGEPQDFDVDVTLRGIRYYGVVNLVPLADESGKVREILGVTRGLTNRLKMEEALRASERRFRRAIESYPYSFAIYGPGCRYKYANQRIADTAGMKPEDFIGKHPSEVFPETVASALVPMIDRTFESGEPQQIERDFRLPDGRREWLIVNYVPIRNEKGGVHEVLGFAIDLTEKMELREALKSGEERFRRAIEELPNNFAIYAPDGTIRYINQRLARTLGVNPEGAIGRNWRDFVSPEIKEALEARFEALVKTGETQTFEFSVHTGEGKLRFVLLTYAPIRNAKGDVVEVIGSSIDLTERKMMEKALVASEERYALAAKGANDGLWDWDITRNRIYFSPRWYEMLGLPARPGMVDPEDWFSLVVLEDLPRLRKEIGSHLRGVTEHFQCEHRIMHSDGSVRWMLARGLAIRDVDGNPIRMAGSQTDITEQRIAEEQLLHDAYFDSLTGLPNRALFMDRLRGCFSRAERRPDFRFAVLFVDIDRFKTINDSLGHLAGDSLLKAIAARVSKVLRSGDSFARFGGDEFTVLIEELGDPQAIEIVANRILDAIAKPTEIQGREIYPTASIGVSVFNETYKNPGEMLSDADAALYQAKSAGRARFAVFSTSMRARVVETFHLETDLRKAIALDQLRLVYQPIYSLAKKRLIAFEALVRWNHPERGPVSPGIFIPIAEESGIIHQIGQWGLRTACLQLKAWQEECKAARDVSVSVNISAAQFNRKDLLEDLSRLLDEVRLPGDRLSLEITETTLMSNPEAAAQILNNLKGLGVQINLDDFGTGYSSLSYLQRFPIDCIKIDRSFVGGMDSSKGDAEIVQAVASLARSLGVRATAEGVEKSEHLDMLRKMRVQEVQGFLFGRPMEPKEAREVLRAGGRLPAVSAA